MQAIILYSNALLWAFTLIYWWKKKSNNVGVVVLALYTVIACVSCHLFMSPISGYNRYNITLFPLLYLYVIINMLVHPLFNIDTKKVSEIRLPPNKTMTLMCVFIVLCATYKIIVTLPEVENGLTLMFLDNSNAVDAYLETTETNLRRKSLTGDFSVLNIILTIGNNFSMLFFFLYLLYPNKNKWILIGMSLALMVTPISSLASGSREKVITTLLVFFFMFFLLKPFLSKKTNNIILYGAGVSSLLLLSIFFIISFARARGENDVFFYDFERYFAMSFLEFDVKCMSAEGTRQGNWVSPLINVLLGGESYSQTELRSKYASLGVDNGTFYTFVGDFVLDYGPILAFIILILIAFYFNNKLKVKTYLTAGHIVLYYALLKLLSGFYLHQYPGVGGNLFILELLFLYIFFTQIDLKTYKQRL